MTSMKHTLDGPKEFKWASEPYYSPIVTINPSWVLQSWSKLSEDAGVAMISELPGLVHAAFKGSLKSRSGQRG